MLVGVYVWAITRARTSTRCRTTSRRWSASRRSTLIVAAAGAATRNLLDRHGRLREPARRPGAPRGDRGRAHEPRPRPARLAGQVRGRHRLRALALARRIEHDPTGAAADARRLADDASEATREAREIIVALRGDAEDGARGGAAQDPARGGAALVGRVRDPGRAARSRTSASFTPWPRASSSGSCARRWATSTSTRNATRVGVHLRRVRLARRADHRRRRARLRRCPTSSAPSAPSGHFGLTGMRERAQLAGGELSVESAPGEGCVSRPGWRSRPAPEALPQALEPVARNRLLRRPRRRGAVWRRG